MNEQEKAAYRRYQQFLSKVVETGKVWGLCNRRGEWVFAWSDKHPGNPRQVLPFWSSKSGADRCAKEEWNSYRPKPIPLNDFLERWLPGMEGEKVLAGINWNSKLIGFEAEPGELQQHLQEAAESIL